MENEEKAWLEFAQRDLGAAQGLISLKYYANACIEAQQAAEKALKAFILAKGKAVPKTHNLAELTQLAGAREFADIAAELKTLSKYYIPLRYPDAVNGLPKAEHPSRKDALKAVKTAKACLKIVAKNLRRR